jgi:hypothetical protein
MYVPVSYMEDGSDPGFLDRARRELAALQANRHALNQIWGAAVHRFHPDPPIAEAELAALEAEHGIQLPADYRAYLTQVGDGGAGPWQGLLPIHEAIRQSLESSPGGLTDTFRHGRVYRFPGDACRWFQFRDPRKHAYVPFPPDEALSPSFVAGSLIIAHGKPKGGLPQCYRLVLTGPERGRVWWDDRARIGALGPCAKGSPHIPGAGFREWMLLWLADCRIGQQFGM